MKNEEAIEEPQEADLACGRNGYDGKPVVECRSFGRRPNRRSPPYYRLQHDKLNGQF